MNASEARKLCPDLKVVQVPVAHGKADLTIYRDAGAQVGRGVAAAREGGGLFGVVVSRRGWV